MNNMELVKLRLSDNQAITVTRNFNWSDIMSEGGDFISVHVLNMLCDLETSILKGNMYHTSLITTIKHFISYLEEFMRVKSEYGLNVNVDEFLNGFEMVVEGHMNIVKLSKFNEYYHNDKLCDVISFIKLNDQEVEHDAPVPIELKTNSGVKQILPNDHVIRVVRTKPFTYAMPDSGRTVVDYQIYALECLFVISTHRTCNLGVDVKVYNDFDVSIDKFVGFIRNVMQRCNHYKVQIDPNKFISSYNILDNNKLINLSDFNKYFYNYKMNLMLAELFPLNKLVDELKSLALASQDGTPVITCSHIEKIEINEDYMLLVRKNIPAELLLVSQDDPDFIYMIESLEHIARIGENFSSVPLCQFNTILELFVEFGIEIDMNKLLTQYYTIQVDGVNMSLDEFHSKYTNVRFDELYDYMIENRLSNDENQSSVCTTKQCVNIDRALPLGSRLITVDTSSVYNPKVWVGLCNISPFVDDLCKQITSYISSSTLINNLLPHFKSNKSLFEVATFIECDVINPKPMTFEELLKKSVEWYMDDIGYSVPSNTDEVKTKINQITDLMEELKNEVNSWDND